MSIRKGVLIALVVIAAFIAASFFVPFTMFQKVTKVATPSPVVSVDSTSVSEFSVETASVMDFGFAKVKESQSFLITIALAIVAGVVVKKLLTMKQVVRLVPVIVGVTIFAVQFVPKLITGTGPRVTSFMSSIPVMVAAAILIIPFQAIFFKKGKPKAGAGGKKP